MNAGCNFAGAAILVNLISGISTILYDQHGGSGKRFKGLATEFYPWDLQPASAAPASIAISCLYDLIRNPLAHALGVSTKEIKAAEGRPSQIVLVRPSTSFGIGKSTLPEDLLEQLEKSPTAPSPTVTENAEGGKSLYVEGGCGSHPGH